MSYICPRTDFLVTGMVLVNKVPGQMLIILSLFIPNSYILLYIFVHCTGPRPDFLACAAGPYGGSGGSPWTDADYAKQGDITRISIRHGDEVDG